MEAPSPAQAPNPSCPPSNPGLRNLIEAKRRWHYRPKPEELRAGFRGWYERGYLPHFDVPNITQFVTFMLADSFPVRRRREWEPILSEPDVSLRRRKLEAWLDRGHGECWLRLPEVAYQVEEILLAEDGKTCRFQAWVIMPNHVHLVVDVWRTPLSRLLNSWKGRSSYQANRVIDRRGEFWQRESFDTLIRDSAHLSRAIHYTESNPCKAALVQDPKRWVWGSARRRDEYNRLPWQREQMTQ